METLSASVSAPRPPALSAPQWASMIGLSFFFLLFSQLLEQALNNQMTQAMQNESSAFVVTALALLFNGLFIIWIIPLILAALLQPHHPETGSVPLLVKVGDFTREWLRSLGEVSLWIFVLILPGLIRLVDYSILPFVCFFDPAYQRGEVPALERCRTLAKGHRWKLWGLWIGFGLICPLIATSLFGNYESITEHPFGGTLLVLLETILQVLTFWLLWKLYLKMRDCVRH